MKELSIEQKAKRYDEAIKKAKEFLNNPFAGYDGTDLISSLFPELKESEDSDDERIRKSLSAYFAKFKPNDMWDDDFSFGDIVAWFERQGEQSKEATYTHEVATGNGNIKALVTEKVQLPKFKKKEWLVENHPNNYARFLQILEIYNFNGKNNYVVSRDLHNDEDVAECEFIETHWHPFYVKDAKDCDVLRIRNLTFIFQEITNNNACHKDAVVAYCSYEDNDDAFGVCGPDCITDLEIITPATKEQRDLLFAKMKEAGYEWDANKKELKKIKQKTTDSIPEDFEKYVEQLLSLSDGEGHGSPAKVKEVSLKLLKLAKIEQKTAEWSEDDEKIYQSIMDDTVQENQLDGKQIDWLRNIKYRNFARPQK